MGTKVVASGSSGRSARISSSSSSRPPWVRASATTCAPDLAKARAAARPMPREAPVTSAIRGGLSCFDALNRHSLHHLLGLLWGMVAGGRKTAGGMLASAPIVAARQAWIFYSADYRLDPSGSAATEKGIRYGS